jgi:hypothetical protein
MLDYRPFRRNRRAAMPIAVLTLVCGVAFGASTASANGPAGASDHAAIRVRVLQSDMMVAALSCDLRNHYNEATRRFQAELVLHGRNLRAYFDRTHGRSGQRELDRFVTAMANEASSRSVAQGDQYCGAAKRMLTTVLALPPNSLAEFSRTVVDLAKLRLPGLVATAQRPQN